MSTEPKRSVAALNIWTQICKHAPEHSHVCTYAPRFSTSLMLYNKYVHSNDATALTLVMQSAAEPGIAVLLSSLVI